MTTEAYTSIHGKLRRDPLLYLLSPISQLGSVSILIQVSALSLKGMTGEDARGPGLEKVAGTSGAPHSRWCPMVHLKPKDKAQSFQ